MKQDRNVWSEDGSLTIYRRNGKQYTVEMDLDMVPAAQQRLWRIQTGRGRVYVVSGGGKHILMLHRLVHKAATDEFVIFLDGNTLNCRRENLQAVQDQSSVVRNGKRRAEKQSQHKYVTWSKNNQKWMLRPYADGKSTYLGVFSSQKSAWEYYLKWAGINTKM